MGNEMLEDDEVKVRPEIMAFAVEMERVMAAHDEEHGDSFRHMTTGNYLNALLVIHRRAANIDEALEGIRASKSGEIPRLAARIGVYAMFFHHGYRNHPSTEVQHDTTD
jgi:hypothetical protein